MKTTNLLTFAAAAIAIAFSSCTTYDSARQGEDDYEAATERRAREKELQKAQQDRSDSAQARSIQR